MSLRPMTQRQLRHAYKDMATKAHYRPEAPSDGMGGITVPIKQLDLEAEADRYAKRWGAEENAMSFYLGYCNYSTRRAAVFAVEAARLLSSGHDGDKFALKLLQMAADHVIEVMEDEA